MWEAESPAPPGTGAFGPQVQTVFANMDICRDQAGNVKRKVGGLKKKQEA